MIEAIFNNDPQCVPIPIYTVNATQLDAKLASSDDFVQQQVAVAHFEGKPHTFCLILNSKGQLAEVWSGAEESLDTLTLGHLPLRLPEGNYRLQTKTSVEQATELAIGWGLGGYQFTHYKKAERQPAKLCLPSSGDTERITFTVGAYQLGRDLINRAPHDLTPEKLAEAAADLANQHGATFSQIIGEDLCRENYPAVHAVGRASQDLPRLIDLRFGASTDPKVTLVGKGVCFDTGGILVKPYTSMALMKKDMGGAAHVLALASMIMSAQLPVRLRLLIPAVDNAISGNAYYPGDVIQMRNGKQVEVGHTDAEGRLILADALAEAVTEAPDLLIDIATLTGAARVALGTDLPAMFANRQETAQALHQIGNQKQDPVWQMPLYPPYKKLLSSDIADLNNITTGAAGYGGAITAALFLQAFVGEKIDWLHFDVMGWNLTTRPAHPKGGELFAIRTLFDYIAQRYAV